jgi:PIN domain
MTPRNIYRPLLKKRGKPHADFSASLEYFRNIIEVVTPELYAVFESESRPRLRGRDESDWSILATALGLACAVWTEDADFFGTSVAVWTTNRIEIFRRKQAKSLESQEE